MKLIIFIAGVAVGVFVGWAYWGQDPGENVPENVVCLPADSVGNVYFNDSLPQEYVAIQLDKASFHPLRDQFRADNPVDDPEASSGEWGGNIERNALYQALRMLGDNPFLEYYFCKDPATMKTFVAFRSVEKQKEWEAIGHAGTAAAGTETGETGTYRAIYKPTGNEFIVRTGSSDDHFCPQRCD